MFGDVGTRHLDLETRDIGSSRDGSPRVTGHRKRIDRVRNDNPSQAQIVFGDRVPDTISCIVNRVRGDTGTADRLFDRIDANVDAAELGRQPPRNRRLTDTREA